MKDQTDEEVFLYTDSTFNIPRNVIHVKVDASAQEIRDEAFKNCKQLRTVDFSDASSIVMISEEAFAGCTSLREADMTHLKELRFIFHRAFQGCSSLEIVGKLPAKLDRIGENAFDPEQDSEYGGTIQELDFSSAENLRFIYGSAFKNCNFAKEIKFPKKLEAVAERAFECSSMPKLDFSLAKSLRFLGRGAFSDSRIEEQVKFPPRLETVADDAFNDCSAPQFDFSAAQSLQKIGNSAFANCKLQTEVRLPATLEEVGEEAFTGCTMKRLDFSEARKLKLIGRWSFSRCKIEKDVKFSSALEGISQRAFTGSTMQRLDFSLADSLHVIGHSAFANCKIDDEVKLPAALEELWPFAFAKARTSSVNLSLCKHLKRKDEHAFVGCIYEKMIDAMDSDKDSVASDGDLRHDEEPTERSSAEDVINDEDFVGENTERTEEEPTERSSTDNVINDEDYVGEDDINDDDDVGENTKKFELSTIITDKTSELDSSLNEKGPDPPAKLKNATVFVNNRGWLEKKSRKRSLFLQPVWERRYFVLEDGVLTYSQRKFYGEGGRMKHLSNVVVQRAPNKAGQYEVRNKDTSKLLFVMRLPAQGSTWEGKEIGFSSNLERISSVESTHHSLSCNSLGLWSGLDTRPLSPRISRKVLLFNT